MGWLWNFNSIRIQLPQIDPRWWFQMFFIIFTATWGRFPFWLIFFKCVETTNQDLIFLLRTDRYFSFQLIDMYTHNFDYLGTRSTGNQGGSYMITGPGWLGGGYSGEGKPAKVEKVIWLTNMRKVFFFGKWDFFWGWIFEFDSLKPT